MDLEESVKWFDLFKIAIVGDYGVGKSSFFRTFVSSRYTYSRESPVEIGVDSEFRVVPYDKKAIKLKIWDSPEFRELRTDNMDPSYGRIASGIIIMYDCTSQKSFDNVQHWLDKIYCNSLGTVPKLLVGNKYDLPNDREVSHTRAKEFASQLQIPYVEITASNGIDVKLTFKRMITIICENLLEEMQLKRAQDERELREKERQERERREKERQEEEQYDRDKKYALQLLIPLLETFTKIVTTAEEPSATETQIQTVDSALTGERETIRDTSSEVERFVCEGTVIDVSRRWKKWKKTFELYMMAKNITDDERKKATLLHRAGPDVQDVYFALVEEDENTEAAGTSRRPTETTLEYERAMSLLDKHFSFEKNPLYERLVFRGMRQNYGESVAQFATRLERQAENCDFGKMLEEHVRDQIVGTCRSLQMTKRFLREGGTLTLERLLEISTSMDGAS